MIDLKIRQKCTDRNDGIVKCAEKIENRTTIINNKSNTLYIQARIFAYIYNPICAVYITI